MLGLSSSPTSSSMVSSPNRSSPLTASWSSMFKISSLRTARFKLKRCPSSLPPKSSGTHQSLLSMKSSSRKFMFKPHPESLRLMTGCHLCFPTKPGWEIWPTLQRSTLMFSSVKRSLLTFSMIAQQLASASGKSKTSFLKRMKNEFTSGRFQWCWDLSFVNSKIWMSTSEWKMVKIVATTKVATSS